MLDHLDIGKILFLDVETVPAYPTYKDVPERLRVLWDRKASQIGEKDDTPENIYQRAGIYAEFGKIICISVGYFTQKGRALEMRITSFFGHDEKQVLQEFINLMEPLERKNFLLCAHNGKEFDFPYLGRRILINRLKLPSLLDIAGKKPWEINHLDTMQLWKFGDYKSYTSLELLTAIFNIPTPKDDIDGSRIYSVYYQDNDIDRIVKYCQKDVLALAQLFLAYQGKNPIGEHQVLYV